MKIAIVYYLTYGHIITLAKAFKEGAEKSGKDVQVDILQVPETLGKEVLDKMHAPAKADYPIATPEALVEYDALVFGFPTRFGTFPAQLTEFMGNTSGLWVSGGLAGKPVATFTSVSSSGGAQEATLRHFIAFAAHHGMVYIPLGYGKAFGDLTNLDEVHGGTPYGAATFAGADGSRQPSEVELRIASTQGETFATSAFKFVGPAGAEKTHASAEKTAEKPAEAHADEKQQTTGQTSSTDPRASQSKKDTSSKEKSTCAKCIIM